MKNMKKAVSFLLVFVMVFAMNFATAFAAEAPENVTEPIEATEVLTNSDEGIMPLVNHSFSVDIPPNSSTTLSGYSIPERYMAFEAYATVMGGGSNGGTFSVTLLKSGLIKSGMTYEVNGVSHKNDWIDLQSTNNSCGFKLSNNTSVSITIYVTYYSWS